MRAVAHVSSVAVDILEAGRVTDYHQEGERVVRCRTSQHATRKHP